MLTRVAVVSTLLVSLFSTSLVGQNAPNVSYTNPASGPIGTSVTITGQYFGTTLGTSTVSFNGTQATPTSWSDTQIVAPLPAAATTGTAHVRTPVALNNPTPPPPSPQTPPPNVS